ncbi:ribonucleoside-triphosphate reductase [Thermococcus sp. M36]|uniref:ribonucleoside-triphosphate reductase n=1 Tax=Thermococcus sp. M36 TaxID=1638261 RepID=UPI00143A4F52|nr:ribonucleoside-triphosphate reductase [Thermococcus sp. M36]NJE05836.1 ribonucleoside-triphosphate reductase [Thermococcus sp. M36]
MEFGNELLRNLEGDGLWTVITFKTPSGPGKTLEKLVNVLEEAGWRVTFRANWWTADIPYGVIRVDVRKGDREKILLGKWILGEKCELIGIENMSLERGRDEFFRMVDSITSTLIYDPVIRTMREQY